MGSSYCIDSYFGSYNAKFITSTQFFALNVATDMYPTIFCTCLYIDGWMASLTQWTGIWVDSGSW